jgi:VanZ family protein
VKRFVLFWLPPLAWMGLIFALSAQPELPLPPGPWMEQVFDKLAHAGLFGVLAWLVWRAFRQHRGPSFSLLVLCVAVTVVYAISDELHQSFVPGRTPSVADLAADAAGAAGATLLARWLERRRARARTPSCAR